MCLIIYTLSDLGDSSNLIGSLSRNMTSYSPRWAVNMKQKKNCCRELDVSRTEYLRVRIGKCGSNRGKAKILILSSSNKLKNKSRNRIDLETSRTNSAVTLSDSRIKPKTYRLIISVPNLAPKISLLIHS